MEFTNIAMTTFYSKAASLIRDRKKRLNFSKHESFLLALNCLKESNFIVDKNAKELRYLTKMSITKIRNRCLLTGRGSAIYSKLRLSRIKFRENALAGSFPGVRKSV
jgi:small subunit ribosomal protein S14